LSEKLYTIINSENLDVLLSMLAKNLKDDTNYITEFVVCDAIIRPILGIG